MKRSMCSVVYSEQRLWRVCAQPYEAKPRKKPPTKPLDRTMFLLMKSVACPEGERNTHSGYELKKQGQCVSQV